MITFLQYLQEHVVIDSTLGNTLIMANLAPDAKTIVLTPFNPPGTKQSPYYQYMVNILPGPKFAEVLKHALTTSTIPPDTKSYNSDFVDNTVRLNKTELVNSFLDGFQLKVGYGYDTEISPALRDYIMKIAKSQDKLQVLTKITSNLNSTYQQPKINGPDDSVAGIDSRLSQGKIKLEFAILSDSTYLLINPLNQTISAVNDDKRSANRMGTYKGGGEDAPSYILPNYGYSMISPMVILKVLKSLKKYNPTWGTYTFIDENGFGESATVDDMIAGKGRIGNSIKDKNDIFEKTSGTLTVYHGTSIAIAQKALKEGLKPGLGPEYNDKIKNHSEKLIYFTTDPAEARKYAVRAGMGKGSAVLQVILRDFTKIDFDEDTLYTGLDKIPSKVKAEYTRRLVQLFPESFRKYDPSVDEKPFTPSIQSWQLKDMYEKAKTKEQLQILNNIGFYGLKGATTSFGYSGSIPARDISIKETFKSEKYDLKAAKADHYKNSSAVYANQYDKVIATRKIFK